MTSITQAARANPAWGAVAALARIEKARRAADSATFTHADQRLLWLFSDGESRTLREIADELGLEQSTVNRQVNAALKSGRVRRFREPGQTAWRFLATDEALAEFVRDLQDHLSLLEQALQAVPEDERSRFLQHFGAFATAYNEAAAQR